MDKKYTYDTHLHLDLYKDREGIIKYIEENKTYTIAVTNLPILYEKYQEKYKNLKYIRFAMGLHPQLLPEYQHQLPIFLRNLSRCKYIGEIGLDFSNTNNEEQKIQLEVFQQIVKGCHIEGDKILSVHSRGATQSVIDTLGEHFQGKVIMHWFTGSMKEVQQAILNGYYFSINSQMVKSQKGLKLLECIPVERILIESDGPFTKGMASTYNLKEIEKVQSCIGIAKGISEEEAKIQLFKNFREIIK